jgi:hypothetical protein
MLGQNDASLRPDLPAFERFDTCERRPGRKTLDQQAKSGDPDVKRHATWGMSVQTESEIFMKKYVIFLVLQLVFATSLQAQSLKQQISNGNIQIVEMASNGSSSGSALEGTLTNLSSSEVSIDVHLLEPVYFRNNGDSQNMIATQIYGENGSYSVLGSRSFISIPANSDMRVLLVAYCADFELDNPGSGDRFAVEATPADLRDAARRIAAYEAQNANLDTTIASQVALWLSRGVSADQIQTQFSFTAADLALAQEILR